MHPLIGLTTYREQAQWGSWDTAADLLPTVYARSVEAAGGVPVLLPPTEPADAAAAAVVRGLDGLVITGGADVDPARYGEEPHPRTVRTREDRDTWELALLEAAASVRLPTLGVCRGMQLMAVAGGGTLEQHLPDVLGGDAHHPGGDKFGPVTVRIAADSLLHDLVGDGLGVHCHHHQAVRDHPGYTAVAWAEDGTLEAMEQPGDRFCLAVQWHPEMTTDAGLFRGLVDAASRPTVGTRR
jgi:putative glutamine amidotransferase